MAREEVVRLTEMGRRALQERCQTTETALIEIVWHRWAAGKLRFTIGNEFVEVPFADWAARLMPPAFKCPHSGKLTFNLAAIDDGRIVAADEIAACEQSGRQMFARRAGHLQCDRQTSFAGSDRAVRGHWSAGIARADGRLPNLWNASFAAGDCQKLDAKMQPTGRDSKERLSDNANLWCASRLKSLASLVDGCTPQSFVWKPAVYGGNCSLWSISKTLAPIRVAKRSRFRKTWTDISREQWPEVLR